MPVANGGGASRWLQDHDADMILQQPPVQNQWYIVFDADDVRLLWCTYTQMNDEVAAKNIQFRWTIDGNVYLGTFNLASGAVEFVFRNGLPIVHPLGTLESIVNRVNGAYYVSKCGLHFKVEVRITSALGTNQMLYCSCVRETLEVT